MANVHILQGINSKGYRLGSVHEQELDKSMDLNIMSISELKLNDHNEQLQRNCIQAKDFNQERKQWNKEKEQWGRGIELDGHNQESLVDYSNKLQIKSKEITSLESTGLLFTKKSEFENSKTKLSKLEVELVSKELVIHSLESNKPVKDLTEPYKNIDTQLIHIPSEEKSYNHIWEIGNVTPYLEKQESTISFPVANASSDFNGGIEAVPIVADAVAPSLCKKKSETGTAITYLNSNTAEKNLS
ncbi:7909_t:CDS:2 [Entrophospora sp. SA101]|nr:7909_t:CDS:2 [Entrophospora sp. SA101]